MLKNKDYQILPDRYIDMKMTYNILYDSIVRMDFAQFIGITLQYQSFFIETITNASIHQLGYFQYL